MRKRIKIQNSDSSFSWTHHIRFQKSERKAWMNYSRRDFLKAAGFSALENPMSKCRKDALRVNFDKKSRAFLLGLILVALALQFAGPDPLAYNAPEGTRQVTIEEKELTDITNKLSVPPLSISIYKLGTKS